MFLRNRQHDLALWSKCTLLSTKIRWVWHRSWYCNDKYQHSIIHKYKCNKITSPYILIIYFEFILKMYQWGPWTIISIRYHCLYLFIVVCHPWQRVCMQLIPRKIDWRIIPYNYYRKVSKIAFKKHPCLTFIQQGSCLTTITSIFPDFVLSGGLSAIVNWVNSACFIYLLKIAL